MVTTTLTASPFVPCFSCGYDLRAHHSGSVCPECGASVAESIRLAPVPYRPAWRNADPRWRRRLLAGVWVLTLLPLMNLLLALGWAAEIPVPDLIDSHHTQYTLDQTFLGGFGVFPLLVFCIGAVLLFSKERGRRNHRMDWTRRWGIGCSYITLLLGAVSIAFITALVMTGIGACFISMEAVSMRARTQPAVTQFLIDVSYAYLRYGPAPGNITFLVQVACSSVVILLGCVPLYEALRSAGNKALAWCLITPLMLFALMHLLQVASYSVGSPATDVFYHEVYFCPEFLFAMFPASPANWMMRQSSPLEVFVECTKWFVVLTIAMWLTVAQVIAWCYKRTDSHHSSSKNK
jgi:hypothetical protein